MSYSFQNSQSYPKHDTRLITPSIPAISVNFSCLNTRAYQLTPYSPPHKSLYNLSPELVSTRPNVNHPGPKQNRPAALFSPASINHPAGPRVALCRFPRSCNLAPLSRKSLIAGPVSVSSCRPRGLGKTRLSRAPTHVTHASWARTSDIAAHGRVQQQQQQRRYEEARGRESGGGAEGTD